MLAVLAVLAVGLGVGLAVGLGVVVGLAVGRCFLLGSDLGPGIGDNDTESILGDCDI